VKGMKQPRRQERLRAGAGNETIKKTGDRGDTELNLTVADSPGRDLHPTECVSFPAFPLSSVPHGPKPHIYFVFLSSLLFHFFFTLIGMRNVKHLLFSGKHEEHE